MIDTGAQANLIRKDLIPDKFFKEVSERLNLRTANGQIMEGGTRDVDLTLGFRRVMRGELLSDLDYRAASFYEADIRVDAIISYPWLEKNGIGIFPHLKALAVLELEFTLLFGLQKGAKNTCLWGETSREAWEGGRGGEGRRRR